MLDNQNLTDTISEASSLDIPQPTKISAILTLTAGLRRHVTTPLLTKPGTSTELLYQLGLEYDTVSTTTPPPCPINIANYPPPSPLTYILPDTAQAQMRNLPLRLLPAPCSSGVAIHSISRSPHSGTCIDPAAGDTSLSLSYNITANNVAQIYLSPTPYNDAFEEILDLQKFNVSCHQAAGLTFLHQDG